MNLSDTCIKLSDIFLDMSQCDDELLEASVYSGTSRVVSNSSLDETVDGENLSDDKL